MINDVRYAARNLRVAPGLTIVIVLTLALGIGANTAIFSIVNVLLFEPLPYPHAERLVAVTFEGQPRHGHFGWPYPKYAALAREQTSFETMAAYARTNVSVEAGDRVERVETEVVTATYFPMLGVGAARGRVFTADEDRVPGETAVVVLSDRLWRSQFGADPRILERSVGIKGRQYQIIGVLPPSFRGQSGTAQMWITAHASEHALRTGALTNGANWWMNVIARLKPAVALAQARAEMPALSKKVDAIHYSRMRRGDERYQLVPFKETKIDPDVSRSFVLLLGAVGLVLLIACANTANLLLGRAAARRRDFAVRRAIGAPRSAIVRQVLSESLLLSCTAAVIALIVALWTLDWLTAFPTLGSGGFWSQYARTFEYFSVSLEPRTLAFNFALGILVGVVFGVAPAWQASRTELTDVLKQGAGASTAGFGGIRALSGRAALVLTEVAFSIVLLTAAGLMIKSFARAANADLGFDPDGVLTMTTSPSVRKPVAFYRDLLQRVQSLPGLEQAALSVAVPLGPGGWGGPVQVERSPGDLHEVEASLNVVTPGFFATYRIRLLEGRLFTDADNETSRRVAVISRPLAEAAFPGQSAVGKRIIQDLVSPEWMDVVGVVDRVTYTTLEEPPAAVVYAPAWQPRNATQPTFAPPTSISVRTSVATGAATLAIRAQVRALDNGAPIFNVATLRERAAQVTSRYRFSTLMMAAMATLALILAAIGTYGVMAYAVERRTREIGIRIALGASARDVFTLIVGGGLRLAGAGIVLGLASAAAAARLLRVVLYDVSPDDPATFVSIAVLMAIVAGLACYLPARRALRVDPVVALRAE